MLTIIYYPLHLRQCYCGHYQLDYSAFNGIDGGTGGNVIIFLKDEM